MSCTASSIAAPGAPELAQRVKQVLDAAGLQTGLDPARGLDHGAWVPLLYLYPDADVPVTQLSIQSHLSPVHHYRLGEALRPLLDEDVLVIGSGSLTHNLREFRARSGRVEPYVRAFQDWMKHSIEAKDVAAVLDYRRLAPDAVRAHPTDEHLLPLFVAMGAAGACANAKRLVDEVTYGVIAMDTYVFEPALVQNRRSRSNRRSASRLRQQFVSGARPCAAPWRAPAR